MTRKPPCCRVHFFARFVHDGGHDAGQGQGAGTGFGGHRAGQRRNHVAAGFGLPPGVHDGAARLADHGVVPHPGFRVDGLAHAAQQAQAGEVILLGQVAAQLDQRADGGRRGVEGGDLVVLDHLPETPGIGVGRDAFKDHLRWRPLPAAHRRHSCGR